MKISWNDTDTIDNFIFGKLKPAGVLQFHSRLLLDPVLKINLILQRKMHFLIRQYARKKLKSELESLHRELFLDTGKESFQKNIMQHFKTR